MEEAVKKHMGLKVKIMRERAKLTQEQLAEECGVSWRTISNLERGLVVPDLTMLRSIAQKFNASVDDMLELKSISNKSPARIAKELKLYEEIKALNSKTLDKMDICIIYEEPGADMTTVFKGRLKFGLFASLDYLSVFGRPKSIEDLQKNHKICTRDNFASVWPRWKEILDGAQNVVASTNATAVLLSLIRDGNGVSLHPIGSASREKDLVFLSELGYEEEHDFWIATRKDYVQRPEVKVLIECIRDATLKI